MTLVVEKLNPKYKRRIILSLAFLEITALVMIATVFIIAFAPLENLILNIIVILTLILTLSAIIVSIYILKLVKLNRKANGADGKSEGNI